MTTTTTRHKNQRAVKKARQKGRRHTAKEREKETTTMSQEAQTKTANATINVTIKGTRKKRESNGRRRVSDDRQQQRETQRCNTGPENRAKRTKRKPFDAISFHMTYLRRFFKQHDR